MKKKTLGDAVRKARSDSGPEDDGFDHGGQGARSQGVVYVRVSPELHRAIKRLAVDRYSSVQRTMEEAIDDLFIKYNRKPR